MGVVQELEFPDFRSPEVGIINTSYPLTPPPSWTSKIRYM